MSEARPVIDCHDREITYSPCFFSTPRIRCTTVTMVVQQPSYIVFTKIKTILSLRLAVNKKSQRCSTQAMLHSIELHPTSVMLQTLVKAHLVLLLDEMYVVPYIVGAR